MDETKERDALRSGSRIIQPKFLSPGTRQRRRGEGAGDKIPEGA